MVPSFSHSSFRMMLPSFSLKLNDVSGAYFSQFLFFEGNYFVKNFFQRTSQFSLFLILRNQYILSYLWNLLKLIWVHRLESKNVIKL